MFKYFLAEVPGMLYNSLICNLKRILLYSCLEKYLFGYCLCTCGGSPVILFDHLLGWTLFLVLRAPFSTPQHFITADGRDIIIHFALRTSW